MLEISVNYQVILTKYQIGDKMLNLENLDDDNVRSYMIEEVEQDIAEGKLYISKRLLDR